MNRPELVAQLLVLVPTLSMTLLAGTAPIRAPFQEAKVPDAAPLELELAPYFGPLRTLGISRGAFTAPFLFDTGGGGTVLALESVKTLELEPFGRGTGFRHDGTRIDGQRAGPIELASGAYRRRGEVGVFDLATLLGGLPPVGGIVALDFFRDQALTIDLARDRLTLETPASLAARTRDAHELEIRLAHQAAGAGLDVMVGIEGLHGTLWFELDCGNVAPVLVAPHAFVELGLDVPRLASKSNQELPILGLGLLKTEVECREMIYDGLLNAAFFERHVVTLDLAHARAWARTKP
jgi:hypothetical protein